MSKSSSIPPSFLDASDKKLTDKPVSIVFPWLLRLRWGAVVCQTLLIIAVSLFLNIKLPLLIVFIIITFQATSNIYFSKLQQKKQQKSLHQAFIIAMFMDVSLLTLLIHYTGGPMNPFTFLYLVHIVVGSLAMNPKCSWALAVFATLCYAGLFLLPPMAISHMAAGVHSVYHSKPGHSDSAAAPQMRLHLQGMWLAFTLTSAFIVFFVSKIQQALDNYQHALSQLQREKNNNEKLASLATLAAGAAHELSTPLATIAVASGEMHHSLRQEDADCKKLSTELIADTQLIKTQVNICKDILYQMSSDAGHAMGEPPIMLKLSSFLQESVASYGSMVRIFFESDDLSVRLPPRTFKRALRSLINNGIDACPDHAPVTVSCRHDHERLYITVSDQGCGMDKETLSRALDPFFTTKPPGKGLGLGLFLARSVAKRYGGGLELTSEFGKGTTAILNFALNDILTT